MKKRIAVVALVSFGCFVGVLGFRVSEKDTKSALTLANIEALSQGETSYKMMCSESVKYTGAYSMPLECRSCSFRYGYVSTGGTSLCPR